MEQVKKRNLKGVLINTAVIVVSTAILVTILSYFMHGMALTGVPKAKDVSKVMVESIYQRDKIQEYTDAEKIELACNLANFLNYTFGSADTTQDAVITLTYELHDKSRVTIAANENTVWWKGKAHPIKENGAFVKLTEGIFFD